jgi:predicted histidine transporter YuiF (NhaC family)
MATLIHSRSFWLAVVAVIQTIVLYYLQVPEAIWLSINGLIGVVIVALTVDDTTRAIVTGLRDAANIRAKAGK